MKKHLLFVFFCLFFTLTAVHTNLSEITYISKIPYNFKELQCLAQNAYFEARGEDSVGIRAVNQVVLNRVRDSRFPKSICEVVYQHQNGKYQFSWVALKSKTITDNIAWLKCLEEAKYALSKPFVDPQLYLNNAIFYHSKDVHPKWGFSFVARINNHIFYTTS